MILRCKVHCLYWEDSEELKETELEPGTLVILRSRYNQRITIGSVVKQFVDTNEVEIHVYMHEPSNDPLIGYDLHMPLRQRKLAPEYTFQTKNCEIRAVGTFNPKTEWEPEHQIFNLANVDLLARNFSLTPSLKIPQSTLENIHRQYDVQ
jgi:hypothetical protein